MINKKNVWFLTLFSLILVLSVYYITMPNELLLKTSSDDTSVTTSESDETSENATLVSLRVEKEEDTLKELDTLNGILTDSNSTTEEKNNAYDKMKDINEIKGEEEKLEKLVKDQFSLDSVITIDGDQIKVVASGGEASASLANQIMRAIQSNYDNKMYVTVKFEQ